MGTLQLTPGRERCGAAHEQLLNESASRTCRRFLGCVSAKSPSSPSIFGVTLIGREPSGGTRARLSRFLRFRLALFGRRVRYPYHLGLYADKSGFCR
jgi:hypothetical protein